MCTVQDTTAHKTMAANILDPVHDTGELPHHCDCEAPDDSAYEWILEGERVQWVESTANVAIFWRL